MKRRTTASDQPSEGGRETPRPVVVVSECLGFGAVRYDGQILRSRFVEALRDHVDFLQVCPEVGIGLGVPRDPVRLVDDAGRLRMLQPATERDLTSAMWEFGQRFLSSLAQVDGFILKSRSPTCGPGDVRVYAPGERGAGMRKEAGLFAQAVREYHPLAPVEDEGRLTNLQIRHHFLASLFTVARFRSARARGTIAELVRFQTEHKLLLMAQSPALPQWLGRLTACQDGAPASQVFQRYAEALGPGLRTPPRAGTTVNALQHAFGYLSSRLTVQERRYFLELLEEYRGERLPVAAVLTVLRAWIIREGEPYLEGQRLFDPYPRALLELADSGQGRRA